MPTLDQLVTSAYRDLADDPRLVFTVAQVEDFIRGGIVELNRVAPIDTYEDINFVADEVEYPTLIHLPYRVELRGPDGSTAVLPMVEAGEAITAGWGHRESGDVGVIEVPAGLPRTMMAMEDTVRPVLRVHGYAHRPLPYTEIGQPSPETGLSSNEEYAVRDFVKAEGYGLLTHDRALFAQWQGQTNNTDTSPTQMMNMAADARRAWDRKRGLIRTVRRYW